MFFLPVLRLSLFTVASRMSWHRPAVWGAGHSPTGRGRLASLWNTTTGSGTTRDWKTRSSGQALNMREKGRCNVASGLKDCSVTTTEMPHEINDSSFWTLRDVAWVVPWI